jgi:hypothetical protein
VRIPGKCGFLDIAESWILRIPGDCGFMEIAD